MDGAERLDGSHRSLALILLGILAALGAIAAITWLRWDSPGCADLFDRDTARSLGQWVHVAYGSALLSVVIVVWFAVVRADRDGLSMASIGLTLGIVPWLAITWFAFPLGIIAALFCVPAALVLLVMVSLPAYGDDANLEVAWIGWMIVYGALPGAHWAAYVQATGTPYC